MRFKAVLLSLLVVSVFLCAPLPQSADTRAEQGKSKSSVEIGVVSIRRAFQECKRNTSYRAAATAEKEGIVAELERLSAQMEADQAGLRALKQGSSDYLAAMKEVFNKQANLQAKQEFHKKQMELKDQGWTEQLYKDILRHVNDVAQKKGLGVVFDKDEVELPAPSMNELMLTVRTHKLLYSAGCTDITSEVLAQLDAEDK